jgi:hypothetical protein
MGINLKLGLTPVVRIEFREWNHMLAPIRPARIVSFCIVSLLRPRFNVAAARSPSRTITDWSPRGRSTDRVCRSSDMVRTRTPCSNSPIALSIRHRAHGVNWAEFDSESVRRWRRGDADEDERRES